MCLFNNKFSINKFGTMKLQALPHLPELSFYFLGLESLPHKEHNCSHYPMYSSPFVKENNTLDRFYSANSKLGYGMAQSVGSVIPFCACTKGSFADQS